MRRKIQTPGWVMGSVVYEVNLRQYTPEGTIQAFRKHLPRLKELGVSIFWFMPLQPIGRENRKGTLGSYYSISNYTSLNPEFGTLEEFISLVEEIHVLGMKVIIDWVANHSAWDHHWTLDHPEFYDRDENGNFKPPVKDWEDVIHLDYGNPNLWDAMTEEMIFWLKETNIDGFRCDMAHLVPTLFWNRVRRDLHRIKPVYMLAESENFDLLEYGFDTLYNWKLLHVMNDLASGKSTVNDLVHVIEKELDYLPAGASYLNFTSNHDENSWQGSAIERLHYYLEPMTVLTFILPGIPLIYTGQEAGNIKRLKFFDKDGVEWKEDKMFALYQKLAKLRKALTTDTCSLKILNTTHSDVILGISISNDRFRGLIFLNLSGQPNDFSFRNDEYAGLWKNALTDQSIAFRPGEKWQLKAYDYLILLNQSE